MCDKALKQIVDNNYAVYWDEEGFNTIMKYDIGFYGKRCQVKLGE